MTMHPTVVSFGERNNVNIILKENSLLIQVIRSILWVLFFIPNLFLSNKIDYNNYITTIKRTIYIPGNIPFDLTSDIYRGMFEHEMKHVDQWEIWGYWFWVLYLLFSPSRLRFEMEAVAAQADVSKVSTEEAADNFDGRMYLLFAKRAKKIKIINYYRRNHVRY